MSVGVQLQTSRSCSSCFWVHSNCLCFPFRSMRELIMLPLSETYYCVVAMVWVRIPWSYLKLYQWISAYQDHCLPYLDYPSNFSPIHAPGTTLPFFRAHGWSALILVSTSYWPSSLLQDSLLVAQFHCKFNYYSLSAVWLERNTRYLLVPEPRF